MKDHVLKHNAQEIKVFLRRALTLSLASLLIICVFGSIIYLFSLLFHDFLSPFSITAAMIAVFAAALIFQPVVYRFQNIVDRWFFRERFDHFQALKRFVPDGKDGLDLDHLSSSLVIAVANGVQSLGAYLLLPSPASGNYVVRTFFGRKPHGRLFFEATSPLILAMKESDGIIEGAVMDTIPSLADLTGAEWQLLLNNLIELLVPVKNGGRLTGMLLLARKVTREPYSSEEKRILRKVSSDAAAAIDNANLYESTMRKQSELEKAMDGVVHAMSLVVESRDPYTAGHQRRVAGLARAIAEKMGLSSWQVMGVHIAGLLHDVGKVAVPSEILTKPGKISRYEYSILKNHSQVGYEIIQKIEFPWPVPVAVLQHHERLNGSGYPAGISGEEIILEARIMGVADVVEAMSSHRPYRPALGLDCALEEISKNRGVLYDPRVVDACLSLLGNNEPLFDEIMAAAAARREPAVETAA